MGPPALCTLHNGGHAGGCPSTLTRTCNRSRSVRRKPSRVGAPCMAQRSTMSGAMASTSSGPTKWTTPSAEAFSGWPSGTLSRTHGSDRQRRAFSEKPKPNRYRTPGAAMTNHTGTVPRVAPSRLVTNTSSWFARARRNSSGSGVTQSVKLKPVALKRACGKIKARGADGDSAASKIRSREPAQR
jgi:hypothetical protein